MSLSFNLISFGIVCGYKEDVKLYNYHSFQNIKFQIGSHLAA